MDRCNTRSVEPSYSFLRSSTITNIQYKIKLYATCQYPVIHFFYIGTTDETIKEHA